jgi:hypothetical protein
MTGGFSRKDQLHEVSYIFIYFSTSFSLIGHRQDNSTFIVLIIFVTTHWPMSTIGIFFNIYVGIAQQQFPLQIHVFIYAVIVIYEILYWLDLMMAN